MNVALVTGSAGLVGSETVRLFHRKGLGVVGIDNDMRRRFFGLEASTIGSRQRLERDIDGYEHHDADIRDETAMERIFQAHGDTIKAVVHAAAQPSHDWAAKDPFTDFGTNANGTLNLLEMTRRHCPDAVFMFTSTNKVYGDAPNELPLVEHETRWEIEPSHRFQNGIDETMRVDASLHSLFGASKLAADILVQEYGRYFGIRTACFRAGCITGPGHAAAELHGFLAYLMKCAVTDRPYTVYGYKGKQVRDNIHAQDLASAFWHFYRAPRRGEVYNIGGGRHAHCSVLEAIALCEEITGRTVPVTYNDNNRKGDHVWWVSDVRRFRSHYPEWAYQFDLRTMLQQIHDGLAEAPHVA